MTYPRLNMIPSPPLMSALSQAWAITPAGLRSIEGLARGGIVEALQAYAATTDPKRIEARRAHAARAMIWESSDDWFDSFTDPHIRPSGVGVLPIRGPLFDRGWWCFQGYDQIVAACEEFEAHYYARLELRDTPDLACVIMPMDSPGGLCMGLMDACAAVRRLRDLVPVFSVADREACSAAEALAAQATESYCAPDSLRGSCGARMTHVDYSRHLAEEGEDVRHFTSGRFKAVGAGDVPRSAETIEVYADFTERWAQIFRELMQAGRGMTPKAFDAMEARIYFGADAIEAGLCDDVLSFDELVEGLETDGKPPQREAA